MSSYDKYFFGVRKYGSSAFKRTINQVSTTSSYISTLWDICARKSSKKVVFTQIRGRTWLLASYIFIIERTYLKSIARGRDSAKQYIYDTSTCRMTFIQTAFDRSVSQLSNARFPNWFKPFLASVRHWKVQNSWKTRSNPWISKSEFEAVGVSFSKNRQKWLSAVAKSFLRIVWCWKLYQKIAWTPRNIFHMHNVPKKCIKHILRAKNEPSQKF